MKMQGQKEKCKDDIKSYSLDRFEQVERSKTRSKVLQSESCLVKTALKIVKKYCQRIALNE